MEAGIFFGLFWAIGKMVMVRAKSPTWVTRRLNPASPKSRARFERRIARVLRSQGLLHALRVYRPLPFMALLSLALISLLPADESLPCVISLWATYVGLSSLWLLAGFFKDYRLALVTYCAVEAAHRLELVSANYLLVKFARRATGAYRLAAVRGLHTLGTPEAMDALKHLSVEARAWSGMEARRALEDLEHIWAKGWKTKSVKGMGKLMEAYRAADYPKGWKGVIFEKQGSRERKRSLLLKMDDIVRTQLPLRRAFPDVYCRACNARGELLQFEGREWVRCRKCEDIKGMQTGIVKVIGQIGGTADATLENGTLHLNLWDEAQHKSIAAEIDSLEIIGGQAVSYDWAVSAVVEQLHHQSASSSARWPVHITGAPLLAPNTQRLLETVKAVPAIDPDELWKMRTP